MTQGKANIFRHLIVKVNRKLTTKMSGMGKGAKLAVALMVPITFSACSQVTDASPAMSALPEATLKRLAAMGMRTDAPIFIRIFKNESELEIWKQKDDQKFYHFKTYPICNWSGSLGPKLKQGDKQAPEGFYVVRRHQMNPNSQFHLSFNLGYPNAFDKSHGRTGAHLMVHGDCKSAGCYAMTDALVEEIYALAREAFDGGQKEFHVHAYPFRMTPDNMQKHAKSRWIKFWHNLKAGYDQFEINREPPVIKVCERRYQVNPAFADEEYRINPAGPCPGSPGFTPRPRRPLAIARTSPGQRQQSLGSIFSTPPNQVTLSERNAGSVNGQQPQVNTQDVNTQDVNTEEVNNQESALSLPDSLFSENLGGIGGGFR